MPEKMNDELLERINGASDQEIQELKAVILADPELSGDFFMLSKEGNDDGLFQYSDRYLVYKVIALNFPMSTLDLNEGSRPNVYAENGQWKGPRALSHQEMLEMLRKG
jgi:hypothetical protein